MPGRSTRISRPKVLVVTDKFYPHVGGTSVCWTEWTRRWPPHCLTVITRKFSGLTDFEFDFPVLRVRFFDVPKLRMPLLWFSLFLYSFFNVLTNRPDVIHCGQVVETGWIGLFFWTFFRVPFVLTLHGEELRYYSRWKWTRWLQNLILRYAAAVAVNARNTERILRECSDYRGPVTLAYPGVDLARFSGPHLGFDGEGPVLLTVGRLMERKGHELVLQCLPKLLESHPGLVYLIAGEGGYEKRLKELATLLGVSQQVRFLGKISEAEMLRLYRTCALFVHPNRELASGDVEGFGIVFLEASACGLPVIGGRSGGTSEAVDHKTTGLLVEPNCEAVGEAILLLLSDRVRWLAMSKAGPRWAERFDWASSSQALWAITCSSASVKTAGP